MFRAVPMMRLQALVLAQDERAVLKGLGQLGAVHLTRTTCPGPTRHLWPLSTAPENWRDMIIFGLVFRNFANHWKSLPCPRITADREAI